MQNAASTSQKKPSIRSKVESLLAGYDDYASKAQPATPAKPVVTPGVTAPVTTPVYTPAPPKPRSKVLVAPAEEAPVMRRANKVITTPVAQTTAATKRATVSTRTSTKKVQPAKPVAQAETPRKRAATAKGAAKPQLAAAPQRRNARKVAISQVEEGILALSQAEADATEEKPTSRRGRPAKAVEVAAPQTSVAPKRRGRPAKAAVEQIALDYTEPQLDSTDTDEITPIERTRDYEMFKLSLENRNIDINHVRNLVDSIREKNLLASYPIIVNSYFEVMDGQHRLEAAKMLGKPVYFKLDDNFKPENIARINTVSKKWALEAYLKHYMAKGNKQYEALSNFATEFAVNIYSAIGLLSGRTAQPNNDLVSKFKSGEFVVRDYEGAIEVMYMRNDYAEMGGDFCKSKAFLNAISRLAKSPLYDHKKMMEKLSNQQRQFVKCNTVDQYLEMLSEIYNYHSRKAVDFTEITGLE